MRRTDYCREGRFFNLEVQKDEAVSKLFFCSSTWEEYNKAKDGNASFRYGVYGGDGKYGESDYSLKKQQVCLNTSREEYKSMLHQQVQKSISVEKIRALCGDVQFYCELTPDDKYPSLSLYYHEENATIRAYFVSVVPQGSVKVVNKASFVKNEELLRTPRDGDGVRISLQHVDLEEAGKITVTVKFGTSPTNGGLTQSCSQPILAIAPKRERVMEPGGADEPSSKLVNSTFSRIRNESSNLEYEWFKLVAPANGSLTVKFYITAGKSSVRLVVPGKQIGLLTVDGGQVRELVTEVKEGKTYTLGIQKLEGPPTGLQLDVSFNRK